MRRYILDSHATRGGYLASSARVRGVLRALLAGLWLDVQSRASGGDAAQSYLTTLHFAVRTLSLSKEHVLIPNPNCQIPNALLSSIVGARLAGLAELPAGERFRGGTAAIRQGT
jgi:hypothetical protein